MAALMLLLGGCGSSGDNGGDGGADAVTPPAGDSGTPKDSKPEPDVPPNAPRKGGVGAPCTDDGQCTDPEGIECFESVAGLVSWPGGYCSAGCGREDDPECGAGASCISGGSSVSGIQFAFCGKECKRPEDCRVREGYTCKTVFPGLPGYCAPPGL